MRKLPVTDINALKLFVLSDRCEAATEPDRELDQQLAKVAGWVEIQHNHPSVQSCVEPNGIRHPHGLVSWAPHYTSSVDAAMLLIPEGFCSICAFNPNLPRHKSRCDISNGPMDGQSRIWYEGASSATPALAMCAAALRARGSIMKDCEYD